MDFVKTTVNRRPRIMKSGDLAIVYERHDQLDHVYLKSGKVYDNRFGNFHHDDIIGKPFGSKIQSRSTQGFIYVLEPTPELWSIAVHTRTQIVNEVDASVVTMMLDVFPGCKVVESGTGSGCMTLSLARAVYPNGHVYTYEYNKVRAETAREEFKQLGVDSLITVTWRDVCGKYMNEDEGGGFSGVAEKSADAVFLDLPEPWLAIGHAKKVLKPGRNICCYSPCIEQVMKTCEKLRELGFHSIRMIEVRQKPYDARIVDMETLDLGLSTEEEQLNNKSTRDPINFHQHSTNDKTKKVTINEQKDEAEDGSEKGEDSSEEEEEGAKEPSSKKRKTDESGEAKSEQRPQTRYVPKSLINGSNTTVVARPVSQMKGHTAFLTFAVRSLTD